MKMQNKTVIDKAQAEPGDDLEEYRSGTNLVLLDADVAKAYPTAEAVNEALRRLMQPAK